MASEDMPTNDFHNFMANLTQEQKMIAIQALAKPEQSDVTDSSQNNTDGTYSTARRVAVNMVDSSVVFKPVIRSKK